MSGLFSPNAPDLPPVPDRGDVSGADRERRARAATRGRNQVLLTRVRDTGNTGMRPRAETATLLSGG